MRIAAYNIEFGRPERLETVYAVLKAIDADAVALNEADHPQVVAELAERLDYYHVWAEGSGQRHIATLSRYPILDWQIYNDPPFSQAILQTTLETPAAPESRLTAHGSRLTNPPLTLYNAHLLPILLLPFELYRWRTIGALLECIRREQPGPHLILGDLNAIGPGDRVIQRNNPPRMKWMMALQLRLIFRLAIPRLLRAGYTDCFRQLHPYEAGFTWMPGNRTTRYDYIMADPTIAPRLRACRVWDDSPIVAEASDHFPLLAEFEWT